jgi:cardiolipin synthase
MQLANTSIAAALIAIVVTDFLLASIVIFVERKNPSSTFAWIIVIFMLPLVGIILYVFLSQNVARQKIYKLRKSEQQYIERNLSKQITEFAGDAAGLTPLEKRWGGLISLHQKYSYSFFTSNNEVSVLTDGVELFDSLLGSIREARDSIHIEYFIIKNDVIGRTLIMELTRKAMEGVNVRLLVDAMGSRRISGHAVDAFKEAGGSFAAFFPPRFKWLNFKLNYRNHRKLVVIDNKVAYIGGFNIGKEYVDRKRKFGHWRDTHLRIVGDSVVDIDQAFVLDWRQASDEELKLPPVYPIERRYDSAAGIQVVSSGPNSPKEEIKHGFLRMISSAKKSIHIQTPYFIPDASVFEALQIAALSGVDVRIMVPRKKDHPFVHWASRYYAGELLKAGAKVYFYEGGFLHSKVVIADGEVSAVGSANFDIRSFRLNFESTVFMYNVAIARRLEQNFDMDAKKSNELTKKKFEERSLWVRFRENMCRLLSDIM